MASKAKNTIETYASRWRAFSDWCQQSGRLKMPASRETLELYITWVLEVGGNRLETVKIGMSAIADMHRTNGFPSPVDQEVRRFLTSCARHLQEEPAGRAALTVKQLRTVCASLGDRPSGIRDKAILLLGFAAGWRSDELTSLGVRSVSFTDEGVVLRLRKSKTDQLGKGRTVGIHRGDRLATCPVRALKSWIEVRGAAKGPLFLRLEKDGRTFSKHGIQSRTVCEIVQRALKRIGVDHASYGSHSLRAGMITASVLNGASELAIMDRTGHKSVSMIRRYARPAQAFRFNPLSGVL